MLELRRTKAGIFTEETAVTLYTFDKLLKNPDELIKHLVPAEDAIKKVHPFYQIQEKNLKQILTGKPLTAEDLIEIPKEEKFAIFLGENFIGVYKKVNEGEILARAEFVFN